MCVIAHLISCAIDNHHSHCFLIVTRPNGSEEILSACVPLGQREGGREGGREGRGGEGGEGER